MSSRKRRQEKERQRKERIRQEKHAHRSLPEQVRLGMEMPDLNDDSEPDPAGPPIPMGGQFAGERFSRRVAELLQGKHLRSVEDVNAELRRLQESGALDGLGQKPWELDDKDRAQEYAYRAMEEEDNLEAARWSRRALEHDPDNLDAKRTLLAIELSTLAERIEALKRAIVKEEETLGPEVFARDKGHFYGIAETRPYMRALQDLAYFHEEDGRMADAAATLERMIELNEQDNLGARYALLRILLHEGRLEEARALLKRFEQDISANWLWGAVLERVLAGDHQQARSALREARRWNAHAEKYLSGAKPKPRSSPKGFRIGHEDEAQCCAHELGPAWEHHPAAREWLRRQK